MIQPARCVRIALLWLLVCGLSESPDARCLAQDGPAVIDRGVSPDVVSQLRAPLAMVLDGGDHAEALHQLARVSGLNVWVQRTIDRSGKLQRPHLGPTVAHAVQSVADELRCDCLVSGDVVLIGSPAWLDRQVGYLDGQRTASDPPRQRQDTSPRATAVSVSWPDAITPSELVRGLRDATPFGVHHLTADGPPQTDDELPHDLWPAGTLRDVSREVAILLVRGQFADVGPDPGFPDAGFPDSRDLRPATSRYTVVYRTSVPAGVIERAIAAQLDLIGRPDGGVRQVSATDVSVTGPESFHRVVRKQIWRDELIGRRPAASSRAAASTRSAGPTAPPGRRDGAAKYSLLLKDKPVGEVLQTLTATGKLSLRLSEAARSRLSRRVTLEAKDQTIRQLIDTAAAASGLTATWQGQTVTIDLPSP